MGAETPARLEILPEYAEGLHALKAEELDLLAQEELAIECVSELADCGDG